MVDNYDRLKELIDIAADSTGKADEQFAKYAETMEYKLNQLATKWEEFRTSFIDEKDFKKLIDTITSLLDKALNLDPKMTAMIIPFAVLFAKTFVSTIFEQFQASRNNFAQLGTLAASGAIGQGVSWLSPNNVINGTIKGYNKVASFINRMPERFIRTSNYAAELSGQSIIEDTGMLSMSKNIRNNLIQDSKQLETALSEITTNFKKIVQNKKSLSSSDIRSIRSLYTSGKYGFSKEEIENIDRSLKIGSTTTSKKVEDSFLNAFNESIVKPIQDKITKLKQDIKFRDEDISGLEKSISSAQKSKITQESNASFWGKLRLKEIDQIDESKFEILNKGMVQGTVQGLQQIGSAVGMMASMMVAGAKATDTLNVGLSMLVMTGVSTLLNGLTSIIPVINAYRVANNMAKKATDLWTEAEATGLIVRDANNKAIVSATAIEQGEAVVKEAESAAEVINTTTTEANTAAKEANNVATAMATSLYAALAIAIAAGIVALAKYLIKLDEKKRKEEFAATSTGKAAKAQAELENNLNNAAKQLSEYSEEADKAKESLDNLNKAKNEFLNKSFLTDAQQTEWTELQNSIAEVHTELIASYDEQGNAILDIGSSWDSVLESATKYYQFQKSQEGLQLAETSLYEYGTSKLLQEGLNKALSRGKLWSTNKNKTNPASTFDIYDIFTALSQAENKQGHKAVLSQLYISDTGQVYRLDYGQNGGWKEDISTTGDILKSISKYESAETQADLYIILKRLLEQEGLITNWDNLDTLEALVEKINNDILSDQSENGRAARFQRAVEKVNEDWLVGQSIKMEGEVAQTQAAAEANLKTAVRNILSSSEDFLNADKNIQDLMVSQVMSLGYTLEDINDAYLSEGIEGREIGDEEYANWVKRYLEEKLIKRETINGETIIGLNEGILKTYSDDAIQLINTAQQLYSDSVYEQLKYIKDNINTVDVDEREQLIKDYINNNKNVLQARKQQSIGILSLLGITLDEKQQEQAVDETGDFLDSYIQGLDVNKQKIITAFGNLGEAARGAFITHLSNDITGEDNKKKILEGFTSIFEQVNDAADAFIAGYDYENIAESTQGSRRRSFVRQLMAADSSIQKEQAEQIFDQLYEVEKSAGVLGDNPLSALQLGIDESTEALTELNSVLESNSELITKYAQKGQDTIRVNIKEIKNLKKMFTELGNLEKGGLDPEQLNALIDLENMTFNSKGFQNIIDAIIEERQQLLNEAKEKSEISQADIDTYETELKYLKLIRGEIQSISNLLDGMNKTVSTYTSAYKQQIDQGYLSADTIKSIADTFASFGLSSEFEKNYSSFINNKLEFDAKAYQDYFNKYFDEIERTRLPEMTSEERLQWYANRKDFAIVIRELETEASSTDKVADAWKDYANQADAVKEKQQSLNDKIDDYNKLLYGNENRKSGLDLLYNYNEAISSFNDEMSRSKNQLSDSQTTDEAINAFTRYSAATHNLLVEEKAKQEEIQRGLNEYGNMIQNGYASYTDQLTGRTIGINFGDYVKYDQATGKYFLNQTLLDRAKFNDEYKSLIEENVENYNKYADEYKKSQDNVLKAEKEFQEQRKEAIKSYANFESTIADALKSQYEEEVNNLKDKYDAMKEEDDDYVDALKEAIDKQRKLRDRESKFEDLAKKERKLSLISRDTSGANVIQQRQLEEEIQKDRQQMLDDAIDDIIDGIEKLSTEQEETREVEIELKEALLENTAYWNNLAQETGKQITSQEEFITLMTTISKDFTELTYVQQLEKIEEYKETFAAAAQYIAMQQMDNASQTGDFIKDTIETTGDEILTVMANTTSALANEAVRAYDETKQKVSEDLEAAKKSIDEAKQALKEAIEKLEEYAKKARDLEYARDYSGNGGINDLSGQQYNEQQYKDLQQAALEGAGLNDSGEIIPSTREEYYKQTRLRKAAEALGFDTSNFKYADKNNFIQAFQRNSNFNAEQVKTAIEILAPDDYDKIKGYYKIASPSVLPNLRQAFLTALSRYANGGLVNFTGPAWVDGTPDKPEAFLNPEDTKRIGEAAKILSNLPIFNSSGEATSTITNNSGDISIEINLNVDKLSSDLDVDEMLNRVKEEIVAVARPAGVNTILTQHP